MVPHDARDPRIWPAALAALAGAAVGLAVALPLSDAAASGWAAWIVPAFAEMLSTLYLC